MKVGDTFALTMLVPYQIMGVEELPLVLGIMMAKVYFTPQ
jgi:hypothetical protein